MKFLNGTVWLRVINTKDFTSLCTSAATVTQHKHNNAPLGDMNDHLGFTLQPRKKQGLTYTYI